MLLSCYGDQDNVSDAFSLRQMVENVDDCTFVDDMFDVNFFEALKLKRKFFSRNLLMGNIAKL